MKNIMLILLDKKHNILFSYNILGDKMFLKLFKIFFYILVFFLILSIKNNFKFYKNIKEIKNPNAFDTLVNKNNRLDKNYVPKDLVSIDLKYTSGYKYLRKRAYDQFIKLYNDAYESGYTIMIASAYRDYEYQETLYNYYLQEKGIEYADKCSARPGHSEHQTGLAIDVCSKNNDYNNFKETKEFNWMIKNAYKYGFILRYPEGKEHITGFKYEPWHYRYVGVSLATYLYKNNLTLEEYKKSY